MKPSTVQQYAMAVFTFLSTHVDQTHALAEALAGVLKPGDIVLLEGDLGAGKTTLIRALVSALGVNPARVSSPTFVLANEYQGSSVRIVHIDAYRLHGDDDEELALLGWDHLATNDTIVLIEWADRIEQLIEQPALRIHMEHAGETERDVTLDIPDEWTDRPLPFTTSRDMTRPCPVTGEPVSPDSPHYPFSSERAQWADLYGWFNESNQINRPIEQADLDQEL